jgi:hypothetical protein
MRSLFAATVLACLVAATVAQAQQPQVPEAKQTAAGLYVTAKEAYEKWRADPENVKIVDVRTPEEYIFIGHPAMAFNVPLKFLEHRWDEAKSKPMKNGWKNSGLPWTYDLDPKLMWLESDK